MKQPNNFKKAHYRAIPVFYWVNERLFVQCAKYLPKDFVEVKL